MKRLVPDWRDRQRIERACRAWGDRDHFVYAAHAADGSLLYVGVTGQLRARLMAHRNSSQWFPEVARWRAHGPVTRSAAFALEARLIRDLRPAHNVRGLPA